MTVVLGVALTVLACVLSAAAGLGGSLVLVPSFMMLFGPKVGIALSAALLCCNNAAKVVAYRDVVPVRASLKLLLLTVVGSLAGARLLLAANEEVVYALVAIVVIGAFVFERINAFIARPRLAGALALGAGLLSGFGGTSGPLKAIALRSLALDRAHLVGAASVISLAGDLTKALVLIPALSLGREAWTVFTAAALLTPFTAFLGRSINRAMGELAYAGLFWVVMAGYTLRLAAR